MEMLIFSSKMPASSRAYMLQYITLVLKLLTFFIAIFASQKLVESSEAPGAKKAEIVAVPDVEVKHNWLSSVINEPKLFLKDQGWSLNHEVSEGLAEVLRNHDLNAEFTIFSGSDVRGGLEKAAALKGFFQSSGLPDSAVTVLVSSEGEAPVKIKFEYPFKGKPSSTITKEVVYQPLTGVDPRLAPRSIGEGGSKSGVETSIRSQEQPAQTRGRQEISPLSSSPKSLNPILPVNGYKFEPDRKNAQ